MSGQRIYLVTSGEVAGSLPPVETLTSGKVLAWGVVYLLNATTASFVVTLPTAVGHEGASIGLKLVSSGAHTVTVEPHAAEKIDGAASLVLSYEETLYRGVTLISDNANSQIF